MDLRTMQTVRRGDVDAVAMLLVHVGTELAQRLQMEIDRAPADVATTKRGDERLAQTVQQRTGEQDRDTRRTGQRPRRPHRPD